MTGHALRLWRVTRHVEIAPTAKRVRHLESVNPMSDDAPDDVVLETLNALEHTLLEGAPPEIRWLAARARPLPRHAKVVPQPHADAFEQQSDMTSERTQVEQVEEAMLEGWTRSAESPEHDAQPDRPPSPRHGDA